MTDALNDNEGIVSIDGRKITNLRFADDIDNTNGISIHIRVTGEKLDCVNSFKYLESTLRR